jgi:hypothetical protein
MRHRKAKSKTRRQRQALNRAMHVLARMRRTGATLTAASREEHIDPRTVRKYLGSEIRRKGRPTKYDRRLRSMLLPTALGNTPVMVRGSRQATLLGRYMSAVGQYLRTGETKGLAKFKGKSIAGHPLITDQQTLTSLAEAGTVQLDSIYALPGSSS